MLSGTVKKASRGETELRPGLTVVVVSDLADEFLVTVLSCEGRCFCGMLVYRCRTPLRQEIGLCRSMIAIPN